MKKAKINPIIRGNNDSPYSNLSIERRSLKTFPKIRGTTIKKENFAEFSLSIPNKTAVEIVAPDLDIPGIIAIA
mgnify:CR=1 FL=1